MSQRSEGVSPTAEEFDLVILGGGPGGYAAALYGASAGLNIAMVEEDRVGGTCLHRGCIPAKELLQTAEVLRNVRAAGEFGVKVGEPELDLPTSLERKQSVVDRLTSGLESMLKGRKVTVVPGRGVVADGPGRAIRVSDGTQLQGRRVVVATGSAPRTLPGLDFDGETVLSSDHVLDLDRVPERVVVVGGGAIGCEFASYLADVGSEVTLLEALPQLVTGVDRQVAQTVTRSFKKRGITVRTGVQVEGMDRRDGGVTVRVGGDGADGADGAPAIDADVVVVSVGRRPRSEDLGLAEAGIEVDERGFVVVDGQMRTTAEGFSAVGDLVATPQLAHVAFSEGIVAVKDALGEDPLPIEYDKVPWGIYCHPEVAFCGLTEDAAKERGLEVETATHRFVGNGRALIVGEPDGLVKVVTEAATGTLLGVHVVGPWATELIAEGYLSVNWEATAADLALLVHAHPTLSEVFGETAMSLTGRSLH